MYSFTTRRGGPPRCARDRASPVLRNKGRRAVRAGVECVRGWDGNFSSRYSIPVITPGGEIRTPVTVSGFIDDAIVPVKSGQKGFPGSDNPGIPFRFSLKGRKYPFSPLFLPPDPARGGQALIFVAKTS